MRVFTGFLVLGLSLACGGTSFEEVLDSIEDPGRKDAEEQVVEPEPDEPVVVADLTLSADDFLLHEGSNERVIVQYSDWRCTHCMDALPEVQSYARTANAQLRFRNFPLAGPCNPAIDRASGDRCELAAGSVCAYQLGRFDEWFAAVDKTPDAALEHFGRTPAFSACLENPETAALVTRQAVTAVPLEIKGTPSFFIRKNGSWQKAEITKLDQWFD